VEEKNKYNADSIQILEGLEAVRKRPSMYIGDVSKAGYHHLVWEALDNSVDEALQRRCNEINIIIYKDGSISVKDNGAGIPVDIHKKVNLSALEVILTKLHAGGKFDNDSYKVSGGLHGVGISVVNALSEWLEVEVKRDCKKYRQTFERGVKTSEVTVIGESENSGTTVRFKPDSEIFDISNFDLNVIKNRVAELSYLMGTYDLTIKLSDQRIGYKETFYHPEGLVELIKDKNTGFDVLFSEPIIIKKSRKINNSNYSVECALQYTNGFNENILTFVNNINTIEGGTHLVGFKSGLSRALNRFAKKKNLVKEKPPSGEDLREGLTAVLSIKIPDPKFESQTKIRLGNREVETLVSSILFDGLQEWLEENPKFGINIFNKALDASRARAAARKAREKIRRKSSMENTSLPFKLADCHKGTTPEKAELYLVEGDSAGGSAITGRAGFQAILPLRGKILNVEKAPLYKILEHKEIEAIVSAIGNGFLNEEFDIGKIRYHKIIIMTDADIDGSHIRTLLLTFFYRKMPNLIKEGLIYLACPPLFMVKYGKNSQYIHEESQLREFIETIGLKNLTVNIGKEKLTNEQLEEIFLGLVKIRKFIKDNFPLSIGENEILQRLIYIHDGPIFSIHDSSGELIEKEFQNIIGVDSPIIQLEQSQLAKFIEKIRQEQPRTTISFLDENEETDLLFHPIHLTPEIKATLHMIKKYLYKKNCRDENEYGFSVQTKKGRTLKVSKVFDFIDLINQEGQKNIEIKRFKGLGEMEPSQLWESTMDPAKRLLYQVRQSDAIEADSIFNILMGSVVEPRRKFIEEHALDIKELDV
jgi:DNA gyrase subunit B